MVKQRGSLSLIYPPSLAVPPQRPPLILRTVQLRAARITNAARPASSRHGRDTKRGSKGKKSVSPPLLAPATHTSSTHQIDRPPWNKCFLILDTQVSLATPVEPESASELKGAPRGWMEDGNVRV